MSLEIGLLRLQDAWRECERHAHYLGRALVGLSPILPMSGEGFGNLTDEHVQVLDQFILRFTKLQDAMGNRLFPAILQCLQEPYEDRSVLDRLNRLEKLGYLKSAEDWQLIRNTRNKFAHDYPDDWERNAVLINVATDAAKAMYEVLLGIAQHLKRCYSDHHLSPDFPGIWPA